MTVQASEIAALLGRPLIGRDVPIRRPRSVTSPAPESLIFASRYDDAITRALNARDDVLVLACPEYAGRLTAPHIISERPRLDFARVVSQYFAPSPARGIAGTAVVSPDAILGENVGIGHFAVIGAGVRIGAHTVIGEHVTLRSGCEIGSHCIIDTGTVIGEEGYGFEFEDNGTPIRIPHVGGVVIGDHVEIGPLCVIDRGTLEDTVIGHHVKIDSLVYIAHNVVIGENSMVVGQVEISGSVTIGKNVWIGPQAAILNKLRIGDGAFIGLGAVVTKSVEANTVVAGNPARVLRRRFE